MAKMSEFKKALLKNIILIVVFCLIFVVFLILFRLNITHQSKIITDFKSREATLSQSSENLSLLIKEWEIAKQYKDRVENLVPDKDDLVSLPNDFQSVAKKDNVSLSFSFGVESNPSPQQKLGSIGFSASVDGKESDLMKFLGDIEDKYYSMKISSLDINSAGNGNYQILFSGQIFFINE